MSPDRPAAVVVLAAGEGTRMKSSIPKVLHAGGRPRPRRATRCSPPQGLDPEHLVVVVGHGRDQVAAHLAEVAPEGRTAVQDQQHGTGHAVRLRPRGGCRPLTGTVVVDVRRRPAAHRPRRCATSSPTHAAEGNAATILTAALDDPTGYGRVVRARPTGPSPPSSSRRTPPPERARRSARSTPASTPSTPARCATRSARLDTDNAQGEHYLTDVVGIARAAGGGSAALATDRRWQIAGRQQPGAARRAARASSTGAPSSAGCSPASRSWTRRPPGSTPT